MSAEEHQCVARIQREYHSARCTRRALDGGEFCRLHDPKHKKARGDMRDAKRFARAQGERRQRDLRSALVIAGIWVADHEWYAFDEEDYTAMRDKLMAVYREVEP